MISWRLLVFASYVKALEAANCCRSRHRHSRRRRKILCTIDSVLKATSILTRCRLCHIINCETWIANSASAREAWFEVCWWYSKCGRIPGILWYCHRQRGSNSGIRARSYCWCCLNEQLRAIINLWSEKIRKNLRWNPGHHNDETNLWNIERQKAVSESFRAAQIMHSVNLG